MIEYEGLWLWIPSNSTPAYVRPTGVVMVFVWTGKWLRASSTRRRLMRLLWKMKSARPVPLSLIMVRRAISCGVWGRMCRLSILGAVETVALGFSSNGLYSGPRD